MYQTGSPWSLRVHVCDCQVVLPPLPYSSLTSPLFLFLFHSSHSGYIQQQSPCCAVTLTLTKSASFHQAGTPYTALRLDMALGSPDLGTDGPEEPCQFQPASCTGRPGSCNKQGLVLFCLISFWEGSWEQEMWSSKAGCEHKKSLIG